MPRTPPPGPFAERVFPIYFEFNQDFLVYQYDDFLIDRAATWIAAAQPRKIIVTGFAATDAELVSGQNLAEKPEIARLRAEVVAETLIRLMPELSIETRWETGASVTDEADADGIPGQSQRRAEIRAVF